MSCQLTAGMPLDLPVSPAGYPVTDVVPPAVEVVPPALQVSIQLRNQARNEVTALPRYYGPLRLPTGAARGYLFPLTVAFVLPRPDLPGSLTDLSLRAAPSHPGKSGDCFYPLLHHRYQASSNRADCPLPFACFVASQTDCSVSRSTGYMLNA